MGVPVGVLVGVPVGIPVRARGFPFLPQLADQLADQFYQPLWCLSRGPLRGPLGALGSSLGAFGDPLGGLWGGPPSGGLGLVMLATYREKGGGPLGDRLLAPTG